MEEDQHHLQQNQYNEGVMVPDFVLAPIPCYHPSTQPVEINYTRNPNSVTAHHFDMLMMAHHHQNYQQQLMMQEKDHHHLFHNQSHEMMLHNNTTAGSCTSGGFTTENTSEVNVCDGGGGGGRWPRQETLALLEIRSRLDHKFKEANQKGPLWDEISRIMSDEHGYQRSGKKCREKFENLYKYYKKTKEGKAGRQDGKHYRFFRQLEALYGENQTNNSPLIPLQEANHLSGQIYSDHLKNSISCSINPTNTLQLGSNVNNIGRQNFGSLSLSCKSSDFNTSSSEDNGDLNGTRFCENGSSEKEGIKKRRRRNWKAKIKEFIDCRMRSLIEIQEVWLAKIMKTMEQTEHERVLREEEWKKREEQRMDRERNFWASERKWIEARDANLMEALRKLNQGDVLDGFKINCVNPIDHIESNHNCQWEELEITKLVQIRASMEPKFEQISGESNLESVLWEEIATRMASLGSTKSSLMCKNKWESINNYLVSRNKFDLAYKKPKGDNSRSSSGSYSGAANINQIEGFPVFGRIGFDQTQIYNNMSTSNLNGANNNNVQQQDQSFFRFLVDHEGGSENMWGNNNL